MKVTLDLKDFETVLNLGVNALFKEAANVTDVVTPFGTFHITNIMQYRKDMLDVATKEFAKGQLIEAIKHVRLNIGCGLKEAKDFCEKLRDDSKFTEEWLKGNDNWIKDHFDPRSQDAYVIWCNRAKG